MAKPKITIIGLGVIGSSLGAGLQRQPGDFEIVGHDREPDRARAAKGRNDVHRTEWNLHRACDGADMVLTAVPIGELPELLAQIGEDLNAGSLVVGIVDVMAPSLAATQGALPEHVHFVVGHPILTGIGGTLSPRPDLFEGSMFCLATGVETHPDAVQLASDLVARVGAEPLFVDPAEHDGIVALVEQMPHLLGAALMRLSSGSAGWREGRKLAGRSFAQITEIGDSPGSLAGALWANRENVLRRLEHLQAELETWQQMLSEGSEAELAEVMDRAVEERLRWESAVILKNWEEQPRPGVEGQSGLMRQMFFGNLFGGARRRNSDE